jgi:pyrimidine oxygenase
MEIGVFLPIGNNGWLISETAPQYMPSFDLNKEIALKAEKYGFDFILTMIKLRGFGGKTQFWEHNLESFTLMAGLAAVTERVKVYATAATLVMPPAIVARMASTIDSISHGRFGLNLVTGWQRPNTTRWACGRATNTMAAAMTCSANMRRSCASFSKPACPISRANISK